MSGEPSRSTIDVRVAAPVGQFVTVCLCDATGNLPPWLRMELAQRLEEGLRRRNKLAVLQPGKRVKNSFAAFRFKAGTHAWEARQLVQRMTGWFFESLIPASGRRQERKLRKRLRMQKKLEHRNSRRNFKQLLKQERRPTNRTSLLRSQRAIYASRAI